MRLFQKYKCNVVVKKLGLIVGKCIIVLLIIYGSIVNSYGQNDNIVYDTTLFSVYTVQNILCPAIENLKLASQDDPALLAWLDLLEVRSFSLYHLGPGAYATNRKGQPKVNIDASFIARCYGLSDLASLIMVNPPEDIMFDIGKQYGYEITKALKEGQFPPALTVDFNNFKLQPIHNIALKTMGCEIFISAIQWVILHEIGHHQLNHFARNPKSLAESREWELAADTWAIQKMQKLHYCLDPLYHFFIACQLEEELKRQIGIVKRVEDSTHPTWAQRVENIERFDIKMPSDFGNWIQITYFQCEVENKNCYANDIYIPRRKMPGAVSFLYQFGNHVSMSLVFFDDGSIHLYGRTEEGLSEIILTNLGSLYPDIRFKFTNLTTGEKSESFTKGYQMAFGSQMSSSIEELNLLVRDLIQLDTEVLLKECLLAVESRPTIINQVLALQKQLFLEIDDIRLTYNKGTISFDTAVTLIQRSALNNTEQMKHLMGDYNFNLMQQKLIASPIVSQLFVKALE